MVLAKLPHLLTIAVIGSIFVLPGTGTTAGGTTRLDATATVTVPNCASATPQPTESAASAAGAMAEATAKATLEVTQSPSVTPQATSAANALLRFTSFTPTDIKFNPTPEKPVIVVIVYSLEFKNNSNEELKLERPQFKLAIDGVAWSDVASTDFQTGRLLPHATQGIVLQSLTILAKATDAQKAVLDCIKAGQPVDLLLTGTMDAYPGGEKQVISVAVTTKQIVIRARKP